VLLDLLQSRQFHYGHPQWPKFLGDPPGNQTSVVFGFKGSGKTAMRLALGPAIEDYNSQRTDGRVLVVNYDEFNITCPAGRPTSTARCCVTADSGTDARRPAAVASQAKHWRLAHHIDAILAEIARKFPQLLAASTTNVRRWPNRLKYDVLFWPPSTCPAAATTTSRTLRRLHAALFGAAGSLRNDLLYVLATTFTLGGYMAYRFGHARAGKRLAQRVQVLDRDVSDRRWACSCSRGGISRTSRSPRTSSTRRTNPAASKCSKR